MFRIWKERRVYDNVFLKELELLIEPSHKTETPVRVTPVFKVSFMDPGYGNSARVDYCFSLCSYP